jgi:hypothetical protein
MPHFVFFFLFFCDDTQYASPFYKQTILGFTFLVDNVLSRVPRLVQSTGSVWVESFFIIVASVAALVHSLSGTAVLLYQGIVGRIR